MLASPLPVGAALPRGPQWVHEVKWDGARALADVRDGRLDLRSRTGRSLTAAFPELAGLARLGDVLLDGEVVALDAAGAPSFGLLAHRLGRATDRTGAALLLPPLAVAYVVFDVLRAQGRDLVTAPLDARREVLAALGLDDGRWGPVSVSAVHDDGEALWAATAAHGLEGVVSKRRDAAYQPGRRSPDWVKRAHRHRRTVVVGGWRPQVDRPGALGALLVGAPAQGSLRYLGRVGSGVAGARAEQLATLLAARPASASPFADEVPAVDAAGARWCAPTLLVEVAHLGWTASGRLRQASVLGVRTDGVADAPW